MDIERQDAEMKAHLDPGKCVNYNCKAYFFMFFTLNFVHNNNYNVMYTYKVT